MCNQYLHECTGLQLARGLAELLELTFPIDSVVDDGDHFVVTDDPITVHCTDAIWHGYSMLKRMGFRKIGQVIGFRKSVIMSRF